MEFHRYDLSTSCPYQPTCSLVHRLAGLWSRTPGRSLGDLGLSCVLRRSFRFSPHQISTVIYSLGSTGKKKREEKIGGQEKQQNKGVGGGGGGGEFFFLSALLCCLGRLAGQ